MPIFSPGFIVVLFLMIEIVYGQGDDIFDDSDDQNEYDDADDVDEIDVLCSSGPKLCSC